jgi:hypothetical protein
LGFPKQSKPLEIMKKWHSSKVVSHWKRLLINCAGLTPKKACRLGLREKTSEKVARSIVLSLYMTTILDPCLAASPKQVK